VPRVLVNIPGFELLLEWNQYHAEQICSYLSNVSYLHWGIGREYNNNNNALAIPRCRYNTALWWRWGCIMVDFTV
jgi:hypothetical protein